jgi:hypothetical protein
MKAMGFKGSRYSDLFEIETDVDARRNMLKGHDEIKRIETPRDAEQSNG